MKQKLNSFYEGLSAAKYVADAHTKDEMLAFHTGKTGRAAGGGGGRLRDDGNYSLVAESGIKLGQLGGKAAGVFADRSDVQAAMAKTSRMQEKVQMKKSDEGYDEEDKDVYFDDEDADEDDEQDIFRIK